MAVISEDENIMKNLEQIETRIFDIMVKLSEIEKSKGVGSKEYRELVYELKRFLVYERKAISELKRSPLCMIALVRTIEKFFMEMHLDETFVALKLAPDRQQLFRIKELFGATISEDDSTINHNFEISYALDKLIYVNYLSNNNNPDLKYKFAFINYKFCDELVEADFNLGLLCPGIEVEFLKNDPQFEARKNVYLITKFAGIIGNLALSNLDQIDPFLGILLEIKKLLPEDLLNNVLYQLINAGIPEQRKDEIYAILERKEKEEKQRKSLDEY